jgi:hypothetical protein
LLSEEEEDDNSLWKPLLNHPIYLAFWIASIITNIGSSMHIVGASWLMTTLTHSPFLISLIPTTTSLTVVLFTIPSGALSGIFDHHKFLLFIRSWMLIVATILELPHSLI